MQDFVKYQWTVYENIAFGGKESAGSEDNGGRDERRITGTVEMAAERGGARSFIEELPARYQTRLGYEFPNTTDLSDGQWQRLATARGFMRTPQLLVLDEPTAALDPLQEAEVFRRLIDHAPAEGITVIVSHRLALCRLVDRIFVLADRKLVETGTHQQLMHQNGYYASMYLEQTKWYN